MKAKSTTMCEDMLEEMRKCHDNDPKVKEVEKIRAMSDNDLCIKIAKRCGWKKIKLEGMAEAHLRGLSPYAWERSADKSNYANFDAKGNYRARVPNYPKDLNAMHEAEMKLDPSEALDIEYKENLIRVMSSFEGCWPGNILWFATARQRAEAFVLTMENK